MASIPDVEPILAAAGPASGPTAEPTATASPLRACLFSLAGSRYAVDVRNAREVAVLDEITTVPRAPRQLVGVANLRGTVLPIVDIRGPLGLPEARSPRGVRSLVVRNGSLLAAVVVDSVLGLEPFDDVQPPDSPIAAGAVVPRGLVAGWLRWAGETIALLDVPRLLAALRPAEPGPEPAQEDRV